MGREAFVLPAAQEIDVDPLWIQNPPGSYAFISLPPQKQFQYHYNLFLSHSIIEANGNMRFAPFPVQNNLEASPQGHC